MGLHNTAHYLKTKGRGKDSELIHMTPNEIKGLRALALAHGGDLSINPETGLPEAGFLDQILPVVAAAGLTAVTAGAATPTLAAALGSSTAGGILAGAGAGALISGGTAALTGKDVGQAALMGGLGGGIAGGMGAYAPTDAATAAATQVPAGAAPAVPTTAFSYTPSGEMVSSAYDPSITGAVTPPTIAPSAPPTLAAPPPATPTMYSGLGPMSQYGVKALPALGLLTDEPYNPAPGEEYDPNNPMRWRLSNTFKGYTPATPNPYYKAQYNAGGVTGASYPQAGIDRTQYAVPSQMPTSAEVVNADYDARVNPYTGMNTGGVAKPLPKGDAGRYVDTDPNTKGLSALAAAQQRLKALGKRTNVPVAIPKSGIKDLGGSFSDMAAKGGVADLGGYSDGGRMLKGPGDGMSDSIPGVIGGRQPARLADGEFVVPADVVSHLGNGSTDAGARKLYKMMDKIRKARTGKKKQAPQVKADKYMPA